MLISRKILYEMMCQAACLGPTLSYNSASRLSDLVPLLGDVISHEQPVHSCATTAKAHNHPSTTTMVHSKSQNPLFKSIHHIHHSSITKQLAFSASNKPIRTIPSGTVVTFDNTEAGFHKINSTSTTADLAAFDPQSLSDIEPIFGPIYVDGPIYIKDAEPGDVLKIEIFSLQTGSWGWTAILPGLGLFKDEITGPYLKTFSLRTEDDEQGDYVVFKEGKVRIPARPFYGTMGVAPVAEKGDAHPLFPRDDIGGNFDCRYWGVGSTVFLRVNVKGALFSVGDGTLSIRSLCPPFSIIFRHLHSPRILHLSICWHDVAHATYSGVSSLYDLAHLT